jgi:predicted nuclease of predicted toxin-antitoxin system
MKIKLDENLPRRAGSILTAAGHDVDSVDEEGLAGADDPTVSQAATADGRLIITMDRGFGDIQRYPPALTQASSSCVSTTNPQCRSSTR